MLSDLRICAPFTWCGRAVTSARTRPSYRKRASMCFLEFFGANTRKGHTRPPMPALPRNFSPHLHKCPAAEAGARPTSGSHRKSDGNCDPSKFSGKIFRGNPAGIHTITCTWPLGRPEIRSPNVSVRLCETEPNILHRRGPSTYKFIRVFSRRIWLS
jgi:hypothetical protein